MVAIYLYYLFIRSLPQNICKSQYTVNTTKQDYLPKQYPIQHLSCPGLSSPVTLVIYCGCEQHMESRQGHTWTCGAGNRWSTMLMTQGKNNRRERALPNCKHQAVFICTDLLSVSNISSSSLEGEEAEERGHFRHQLALYLTNSITQLETKYCMNLETEYKLWI